jgi:class 3 adenylate cyclase/tetratricopeptide (TPR) repeat protein
MEVRKTVTILFSDVVGSTSLGEQLDPESLRGVMSRYFDEMRTAIERHGGTVEKFIGDAVMAVFGVPTVHEDDALRAVRAASEMRELLRTLNDELSRDWRAHLEIRTGINTGQVVATDPSTDQTFVTGDAVNVAARLEQAAEPGEILLGEETRSLVRDAVRVEPVEPLELKGKSERMPAFRLLEVLNVAVPFSRRLDSPIVGREEELAVLRGTYDDAVERRACASATVLGDAGLGKSRLVNEFVTRTGDEARVLWARCVPYGEGISLLPVVELVDAAAGVVETDAPDTRRSKIGELTHDAPDGKDVAERLAAAVGLAEATGDIQQTFWAVRRLLEIVAAERPLIVVLEDLHWAEPTFLDLLQYVTGFSTGHPLVLLGTSRPDLRETRPDWIRETHVVELEPLTDDQSQELIGNLLGAAGLTDDTGERISSAAEGNPLFVEEMLRMLIDEGRLQRTNGHWTPTGDLSEVDVPGTINALLAARLDQLEPDERAVVQRASVIGRTFWWGAVTELSPQDVRSRVGSHLQTLLRKELVRPDASTFVGEDAFRFSHVLVRDAAYGSTPKRARAVLHERFATWLLAKAGDRAAEFGEVRGAHLESAYRYAVDLGPPDEHTTALASEAAGELGVAGRRALDRGDVKSAVNLFDRAVELLPEGDHLRAELLAELGIALAQVDIARAEATLTAAVEAARAANDPLLEARAALRRVFARLLLDPDIEQAAALAEAAGYLDTFEEWGDDVGMAEGERIVGTVRFWQGHVAESGQMLEQALEHATRAGGVRQRGEILRWLLLGLDVGPQPVEEGLRRVDELVADGAGDPRVQLAAARTRAELEAMRGRFDVARENVADGKRLAQELGDQVTFAAVHRDAAAIEMLAGDLVRAEEEARVAYEIHEGINDLGHLSSVAPDLGDAIHAQGRYDEALEISEFAESITIEGDADAGVRWRQLRAKSLARRGDHADAERFAREAVTLVGETDYLNLKAHALMSLAEVLRLQDRADEARATLEEAIEFLRRKGNVVGEANARRVLEELDR